MIQIGRSKPAMPTIISRRLIASRVSLAWIVVMLPSWPVFMAWSMSSASGPRHSPMMIRSGRMRKALRTRSRVVTSPWPSMFGGRVSIRTTCGCWSCSSAASSMVATRSSAGMNADRALSSVVLPLPVPPEMTMLTRALTQADEELDHLLGDRLVGDQIVRPGAAWRRTGGSTAGPRPGPGAG